MFLPGGKEVPREIVHIPNFHKHKWNSWLLCDTDRMYVVPDLSIISWLTSYLQVTLKLLDCVVKSNQEAALLLLLRNTVNEMLFQWAVFYIYCRHLLSSYSSEICSMYLLYLLTLEI